MKKILITSFALLFLACWMWAKKKRQLRPLVVNLKRYSQPYLS